MSAVGSRRTDDLPDDVEKLKALVGSLQEKVATLEHNIDVLKKIAFGPSSEKRRPECEPEAGDEVQGHLFVAEIYEEAQRTADELGVRGEVESRPPRKPNRKVGGRRGKEKLPGDAPIVRTTFDLPESERECCDAQCHEVGEDVRRELERIEVTVVHEIATKKYGCRACGKMKSAPGPERVIEKGILGKGFLVTVLLERFQNHMPYYRLEKKYGSEGLALDRSVLQRSMARVAELLEPLWSQLQKDVLASPVIFTDDTPVTVAQSQAGGRKTGRTWIYLDREGRHYYDFTEGRGREGPERLLADYKGFIQADAYPGYDGFFVPDGATEIACWAHARRKFVTAEKTDPELSKEIVDLIRKLYDIEREAKDLDDDARRVFRQEHSRPVLDAIEAWLELARTKVLPKSPMGTAITYASNQWEALVRYVDDGRLAIDNNPAERAMRPFAVGRKNWLFFQKGSGGKTAAIIASLLQSAKAAGIDPRTYFRDVLTRIAHCSDVTKLTPHEWKQHFAQEAEERRRNALRAVTVSV